MSSPALLARPQATNMRKKHINDSTMEKEYLAPAVRVLDLHMDTSFCLSGKLEDTYDDPLGWDD